MKFKNLFSQAQLSKPKSSRFDLSHDVKLSFDMGELIPTLVVETLPGDSFNITHEIMARFAPLVSPVMHKVEITTHYFFVPNRLMWPEWEEWITGDSDAAHPYFGCQGQTVGKIGDYLGYNNLDSGGNPANPFPLAAYQLIWDEYYRDQNLQTEQFTPLVAGENSALAGSNNDDPLRRSWMHDYFTSCLPFAQKGDEVLIPLGQFSDVPIDYDSATDQVWRDASTGIPDATQTLNNWTTDAQGRTLDTSAGRTNLDISDSHTARTSALEQEANSITTLRRAFKLQEWLERNARGGTRYIENILAHFGVRSKDARLQRPEYIGGSKGNMTISEVLSTADTTDAPVGQMAGHGIGVTGGNSNKYFCSEHGWILGISSVMPVTAYQQGQPRSHTRSDRLDYAWPTFAHIGEQPVLNQEIYADGNSETRNGTFGYMPRYSEYRHLPSRVAGLMKTDLAFWHLGRTFDSAPALNAEFIECKPSKRIFADTDPDADTIYAHVYNHVSVRRRLPKYGTPKM